MIVNIGKIYIKQQWLFYREYIVVGDGAGRGDLVVFLRYRVGSLVQWGEGRECKLFCFIKVWGLIVLKREKLELGGILGGFDGIQRKMRI